MTTPNTNVNATRAVNRAQNFTLSLTAQISLLLFTAMLIIWTALFSSYPAVHDAVHALRHALYLISCH